MGLLVTFFLLAFSAILVSVAPANVTTKTFETPYGTVTVGEEPRGRGTFGIILSCTLTFGFCVWTAVHPNIFTGAPTMDRVYYKTYLMSLSIMVPEALAVLAFGQWREAKVLLAAWRSKMGIKEPTWGEKLKFWKSDNDGFGLEGAFFVVIGGFVVDLLPPTELTSEFFYIHTPGAQTTTLTSNGFLKYLNEGYIHDRTFDRTSIGDKGKSSAIAKLVAGSQALWFMVQCASRWWVGLPLTLLEIHVGIQVLDTAVLYAFWWSKPLDVNTPIKIVLRMKDGYELSAGVAPILPVTPVFSESDLEWEIAKTDGQLLDQSSVTQSFWTRPTPHGFLGSITKGCHDVVIYITGRQIGPSKQNPIVSIAFEGGMACLNGVLHAAAWNSKFPTLLECWLWRVSSIGISVFPAIVVYTTLVNRYEIDLALGLWKLQLRKFNIFTFLLFAVQELGRCIMRHSTTNTGRVSVKKFVEHSVKITFHLIVIFSYMFSISFITWESYISLRSPADGTFMTTKWTNYMPHV